MASSLLRRSIQQYHNPSICKAVSTTLRKVFFCLWLGLRNKFSACNENVYINRADSVFVVRLLPHLHQVYLHVITYNEGAIGFYESNNFQCMARRQSMCIDGFGVPSHDSLSNVADFYCIEGQNFDSFVYMLHINGGRRPLVTPFRWRWYLNYFSAHLIHRNTFPFFALVVVCYDQVPCRLITFFRVGTMTGTWLGVVVCTLCELWVYVIVTTLGIN